jgi:hypothetical protein
MTGSCKAAMAALAFGLTIGLGAAAGQESSAPCRSAAPGSPCEDLSKLASEALRPDPAPTGSIGAPHEAKVGVLVTPDALNQLHRDVQLVIPDTI